MGTASSRCVGSGVTRSTGAGATKGTSRGGDAGAGGGAGLRSIFGGGVGVNGLSTISGALRSRRGSTSNAGRSTDGGGAASAGGDSGAGGAGTAFEGDGLGSAALGAAGSGGGADGNCSAGGCAAGVAGRGALSWRCNNAVPGVVVAAPGESLMPEPSSGDSRRSVTSSTPSNCSPRFALPPGAVPNRMTTSRCNSIDRTTNWVSVGGAVRVEVAEWRAGGRCVITEGVGREGGGGDCEPLG